MQKTTRLQRLLAVIVAVFMAVCCLPLNAFAEGENGSDEKTLWRGSVTLVYRLEGSYKEIKTETVDNLKFGNYTLRDVANNPDEEKYEIINLDDQFKLNWKKPHENMTVRLKEKDTEKKIIVNFNNGDGTWTDGVADGDPKQFVLSSKTPDAELTVPAEVKAPEGMELANWTSNVGSSVLNAGDTFTYNDIAAIVGTDSDELYIAYTAQYTELPEKKIIVNFNNGDGTWTDGVADGDPKQFVLSSKTPDAELTVPADVKAPEGKELVNWTNNIDSSVLNAGDTFTYNDIAAIVGTDSDELYIAYTAQYTELPEKKIIVNFNNGDGTWTDGVADGDPKQFVLSSKTPDAELTVPADVKAPEGKELVNWTNNIDSSVLNAGDTFTYNDIAAIVGTDSDELYIAYTAQYADATAKKIIVNFNNGDGTWTDGVADGDPKQFVLSSATPDAELSVPADIKAPEGKKLVNWTNNIDSSVLNAGDTFTYNEIAAIVGTDSDELYIAYTAQYEEVTSAKTLKIYWAIDNPEAASWKLYDGNARTETIAWSDRGNTFVMPELNIAEGYELAGWSVSGTQGNYWDANTYNFGLTGLIVEDEEGGYVSITANVVKKDSKTLRVTWNIDNPEAANWKLYDGNTRTETFAWDDRDNTMVMPELEIADGYMLKGWTVDGQTLEVWNPNLETVCLKDKYVEDEHGAHIFITANIVKKDADGDDSSSDSSSNNNTTATVTSTNSNNNNTQVVKAEAPADNTAKVMPQTGLTAETPVVFGVMMVAALAGAGAYLFAIRKKLN